ncbi:MAG TPA: HAD-IA family hydrolase [Dermatophilaceae bacterium]|nr:HAD-IA family hydrolase [Dermatophilaceae bacterium]
MVFDLGNVLIRWDPAPAIGQAVGPEEAQRFLADTSFDFLAWNHHQDAGRDWESAESMGIASHPHWEPHIRGYRKHFVSSLLGEVEGTAAIVSELHSAGVRLYGLTNWSAELFPHAREHYGVLRLLDDIVVSGEERLAKPDPAIFEVLRRRIGVPLDRAVFVDDSPRNVAAAAAAGLDALTFTDAGQLRRELVARGLLGTTTGPG